MARGPVIVRDLEDLRIVFAGARALNRRVVAVTGPDAAAHAGVLFLLKAVEMAHAACGPADVAVVLDAGDDPAIALAALRSGWRAIAFSGRDTVFAKLADMARKQGARIVPMPTGPALDLAATDDPHAACRAWLQTDA